MKSIVFIGTSLDGFIARTNGDIDWLVQFANDEAVLAFETFMSRIDAILIGRGTFEKVLSFPTWPYDKKFHMLLNIAVGGNWGGAQGVDDTIFPATMEIDYVRYYPFTR